MSAVVRILRLFPLSLGVVAMLLLVACVESGTNQLVRSWESPELLEAARDSAEQAGAEVQELPPTQTGNGTGLTSAPSVDAEEFSSGDPTTGTGGNAGDDEDRVPESTDPVAGTPVDDRTIFDPPVAIGTTPGSVRMAERPRNNPTAADLLDHWGHRRVQSLVEGLALSAPATESDGSDLETLRSAVQTSDGPSVAPDLQEGDEVRVLGTHRGVTYGRWTGGPADTLSIELDLSGAGTEMRDNPTFQATLERAGKAWGHRVADTWAPWTRAAGTIKGHRLPDFEEVQVGAGGEINTGVEIHLTNGDLGLGIAGRATSSGYLPPGDSWEPRFGSIEIDTELLQEADGSELFETLAHEIGHVLGAWQGGEVTEDYASYTNEEAGSWTGPNVVAIHGGHAPFQNASNPTGWVEGERDPQATEFDLGHSGVCSSLMAYCGSNEALTPFLPQTIDFAFLADLGMTIVEETDRPETYGLAGWTDYAGFTLAASRALHMSLADPQPHYDGAANPWQTLQVTDLLHVGADAFGYRSAGDLRMSYPLEGEFGKVCYAGGLIGAAIDYERMPPVTGDATLAVDLGTLDGTASFTSLAVHTEGAEQTFADGALYYPFELSENAIVGTGEHSTLAADFYGPEHEDVAGTLLDPRAGLLASFGATHDDRPDRGDVVESADKMAGLSLRTGATDPADNGWFQYRCEPESSCEVRDYEAGQWSPWATTTRENVLAATAGWERRETARLVQDRGFMRIERQTDASTDGRQGRHVVDGYMVTMENGTFGTGFQKYSDGWADSIGTPGGLYEVWTGAQGAAAGSLPDERARWSGRMLGYERAHQFGENPFVEGVATVDYHLSTNLVDVAFSEVESRDAQRTLPDFGFEDLRTLADGTFWGGAAGVLNGAFLGTGQEEVAGAFSHNATYVVGSFGARRVPGDLTLEENEFSATQAPIVNFEGSWHVGADIAPAADQLTAGIDYNGVAVSSGRMQDGESADRVIGYLETHVGGGQSQAGAGFTFGSGIPGLPTFPDRPIVRIAEGTSDKFASFARRAVEHINTALPYDERIVLGNDPAPPLTAIADIPDGQLFIDFAPSAEDWNLANSNYRPGAVGIAEFDAFQEFNHQAQRREYRRMRASHVWFDAERILNEAWVLNPDTQIYEKVVLDAPVVDPVYRVYPDEDVFSIMVHELLHALGFPGHNPYAQFSDSIMRDNYVLVIDSLPEIDGDALLAAYDRFEPGTLPEGLSAETLGPWEDRSFHLRGDLDFMGGQAAFGVALRNGLARPWASGPEPLADLADNSALFGTVSWNGALLGITPSEATVAGSTRLAVELATLEGQLDFADMEYWGTTAVPGTAGSGTTWGDGDLGYSIAVRENAFVQTGGDDGEVTGAFFGAGHEAMGGVLERSDLSAGFGGTR